jgi:D-alanine-D-alanine ligase-like ATP-grasp enzyme
MSSGSSTIRRSLPDIAVLRGGDRDFKRSLSEGAEILSSLTKLGYTPLDVLITKDGEWTLGGRPTDAHYIYTRAHTVVDSTRMINKEYHTLAKNMNISLLLSEGDSVRMNREDMYRLLRQREVPCPDTVVIRSHAPLEASLFRKIWTTFHTPLLIRPLHKSDKAVSKIVTNFKDLESSLRDYHARGVDTHVLTYKRAPTSSVAAIPNFRGEELYIPIWVETFSGITDLPNSQSKIRAYTNVPNFRKEQMRNLALEVYHALGVSVPIVIDVIPRKFDYVVVNVELSPSLRKEGRFMQSLSTTGVDVGQYIHSYINNEFSR